MELDHIFICTDYKAPVGHQLVEFGLIYNVDKNEYIGCEEIDILLNFTKVQGFEQIVDKVPWCNF